MATHQAVEQIINLRYTLCMLGVPLDDTSWLFGDNKKICCDKLDDPSFLIEQMTECLILP